MAPSVALRKIVLPPSWAIAASKLARVRSDCFSNTSPRTRPAASGGRRPAFDSAFSRAASANNAFSSDALTSITLRKCRILNTSMGRPPRSRLGLHAGEDLLQDLAPLLQLGVAEVHRR